MKLFHYAAADSILDIQREGLTEGFVWLGPDRYIRGQWLTDDDDWNQEWATQVFIPENRTAFRFKVCIPKSARGLLHRWEPFARDQGLPPDWLRAFNKETSGHWYIFLGRIPPGWLRGLEKRPAVVSPFPASAT
jgi:hypothetical protein